MTFAGPVIEWRGPAPFYYVEIPAEESAEIKDASSMLTYGWGCIPVRVTIGETTWETSLFPKDDRYLVPLKVVIRKAEGIDLGMVVDVEMVAGRAGSPD